MVEREKDGGSPEGRNATPDRLASTLIYAAGVVLAIILCVGGWTLKIASDVAVNYFNTHQISQPPANPAK
jgi:hypothetical protein